jgi:hypothetical protein
MMTALMLKTKRRTLMILIFKRFLLAFGAAMMLEFRLD